MKHDLLLVINAKVDHLLVQEKRGGLRSPIYNKPDNKVNESTGAIILLVYSKCRNDKVRTNESGQRKTSPTNSQLHRPYENFSDRYAKEHAHYYRQILAK